MGFIQLVEFSTDKVEEMRKLSDQYREESEGKRSVGRGTLCRDRNQSGHYVVIAEFESPEAAQENSNLPETQEFAKKMDELAGGTTSFRDLEVVDSWEG